MDLDAIVKSLTAERDGIDAAIKALTAGEGAESHGIRANKVTKKAAKKVSKKRGGMSPEGKAKVAAAQRERWARLKAIKEAKAPAKKTAKKTAAKKEVTA